MKSKPLMVGVITLAPLLGVLVYGIITGCGYCGPVLAVLLATSLAASLFWALLPKPGMSPDHQGSCCNGDHEWFWYEEEMVTFWHGDTPIIEKVSVKRCGKCDREEIEGP